MIIGFTFVILLWIFKVKLWLINLLFRLQVLPYKVRLHLLMVINLRNRLPTTLRILCKKNVKLSIYSFPCRYRIYFYNWNILYKHRNKYNIPSFVNFLKKCNVLIIATISGFGLFDVIKTFIHVKWCYMYKTFGLVRSDKIKTR